MKFLEMLKKIFKSNNQYEGISQTLACLNDIVPMPKRTDFHSNQSKLDEIDSYKAEYLKLLKQNRTITSIDLMPEYLHEYKNIYTDLLLNLCIEDNSDISFDLIEETGNSNIEHLDLLVKCSKLMLYQQTVILLEEDTRLHLIALNEILEDLLNEKLFTRLKSKEIINSILNEISNLHSALIVFINQKVAMKIETDSYMKDIGILPTFEVPKDYKESQFYHKKIKEIENMLLMVDEKEFKKIWKRFPYIDGKFYIAIIEQKLEIYVYTHRDILETLKEKVQKLKTEIDNTLSSNIESLNETKRKYLEKLKELELSFKMFSIYGRNLVTKNDLKEFYEIKFKILTLDVLYEKEFNIFQNLTFIELECYQEIVFKKIEDILKGRNHNVNFFILEVTICSGKSLTDIIGYITKTLKDGENEFLPYKILQDKKLLSLLLAFDEEDGLKYFFKNTYVSIKDYKNHINFYSDINLYNELIVWLVNIPLETLYRVMKANLETNKVNSVLVSYIDKNEPLFYLFDLYYEYTGYLSEDNYSLPVGVAKIDFDSYFRQNAIKTPHIKRMDGVEELMVYIRNKAKNKPFVTPKTLRSIKGNFFYYIGSETIIFNEGLELLDSDVLASSSIKHVEFASTLEDIYPVATNLAQLKTITIRINKRNVAFEKLIDNNQLSQCFKLEETKEIEDIEGNKRDGKEFNAGDLVFRICKLVPTFDELIFINEDGKKTIYTKEMLELVTRRKWKIGLPIWWEDTRYLHLTQEEDKLIADKFREIYCDFIEQKYITESKSLTLKKGYYKK